MGSDGVPGDEYLSRTAEAERNGRIGRVVEWVKVDGDRLLLTAGLSALLFGVLLLLNAVGVLAFRNANSVTRMASGMIAGSFSLVTLVVSVNQLILSQEFSSPGQYRDQFSGVMEFRRDIEAHSEVSTTPVRPTQIVEVLAGTITRRANELDEAATDHPDEEFRRRVGEYTDHLEASTERMEDRLDKSSVEAFDALSVAIEYDDAQQISAARSLRNDASELTEEMSTAFDELIETLRLFSIAREQFKTVYLQRELTRFSQITIYSGVPAVLAAVLITLIYGEAGSATLNAAYLPYLVSLLATIVFVPLLLLSMYILRTATMTRRTAATGPMRLGKTSED